MAKAEEFILSIPSMRKDNLPSEIAPFVTLQSWNVICDNINGAVEDGTTFACFCEIGVCSLLAFPCIFCCHAYIEHPCVKGQVRKKCEMLNDTLFYGVNVMVATESNEIIFNFSRCQPVYINPIISGDSIVMVRGHDRDDVRGTAPDFPADPEASLPVAKIIK